MNKQVWRPIGVLFVSGFSAGLAILLLNLGDDKYSLFTPLFYGIAGGVCGITWVLLSRYLKLTKNAAGYLSAATVSGISGGLVLLQFGHAIGGASPDPGLDDHIAAAIGFGIGGFLFGLLEWKFKFFSSRTS